MNVRYSICTLALLLAVACGSDTPTTPNPPDSGPPVNNTPPVIGKFTVQGTRANEPPNFADASEAVLVTVEVTDAESQVSDLKFNWSSELGTFSGTGSKITWTAPATVVASTSLRALYPAQGSAAPSSPPITGGRWLPASKPRGEDVARRSSWST